MILDHMGLPMANEAPIPYLKLIKRPRVLPEKLEAADIMNSSFSLTEETIPKDVRCVICTYDVTKGALAVNAGLIGSYSDWPAPVYLCHTDCILTNIDLLLVLEKAGLQINPDL